MNMVIYPAQSEELIKLLQEDQAEKRNAGQAYFTANDNSVLQSRLTDLNKNTNKRASRMLAILNEIGEPSLSNIGEEAAIAMSVLAVHSSMDVVQKVLSAFEDCYKKQKSNTYYQAIPPLTDWLHILERKPQIFGTQWLFDSDKQPFLPTVEDFEHVNDRRAKYGIEPLHWPKSLAIPESEQPWLKRPLSELIMREPTDEEYNEQAH